MIEKLRFIGVFALSKCDSFAPLFQKRTPARRQRKKTALSFVSFSLGLFIQRKAANPFVLSRFVRRFFLCYQSHKEKSFAKKKWRFSPTRRAPTFEKVGQNNQQVPANIVRDKSKFESQNEQKLKKSGKIPHRKVEFMGERWKKTPKIHFAWILGLFFVKTGKY